MIKRKEAGEAIIEMVRKIKPDKVDNVKIGTFAGLNISISNYQSANELANQREEIEVTLSGETEQKKVLQMDSPLGLISSMTYLLDNFKDKADTLTAWIKDYEKDIEVLKGEEKKHSPKRTSCQSSKLN